MGGEDDIVSSRFFEDTVLTVVQTAPKTRGCPSLQSSRQGSHQYNKVVWWNGCHFCRQFHSCERDWNCPRIIGPWPALWFQCTVPCGAFSSICVYLFAFENMLKWYKSKAYTFLLVSSVRLAAKDFFFFFFFYKSEFLSHVGDTTIKRSPLKTGVVFFTCRT